MPNYFILRHESSFQENIEIRRVFVHPNYKIPLLYNDIAIAELGESNRFAENKEFWNNLSWYFLDSHVKIARKPVFLFGLDLGEI